MTVSHDDFVNAVGRARVWDSRSGDLVADLGGLAGAVNSAAFSPDGRQILTASDDAVARLWNARSGALLAVLEGPQDTEATPAFSPDGQLIVTAGGRARIWDAHTGSLVAVLGDPAGSATSASFSSDGKLLVMGSEDGAVRIYRCDVCGTVDELLARAREQLARG